MQVLVNIPDNYDLSKIKNGSIAGKIILEAVKDGISLEQMLDKAYEDFGKLKAGDSYIIINGVEHSTDVGYAMEGIGLFIDFIKECLLDEITKSYCDTCERSSTCVNRSDDTRWCSHYVNKET